MLADPITLLFPSAILTLSSFQAQESPDNSLFSFQIGSTSQEGEEATSADLAVLSDEIKAKLQESLQFLNQDIGQLIKNAQPIRAILEELEGRLPEAIEDALTPAAFIESHRAQSTRLRNNSPIVVSRKKSSNRGTTSKLWQNRPSARSNL